MGADSLDVDSASMMIQHIFAENSLSTQNIVLLIIILFLIIGSALISGSEIAFFSFKKDDLADFEASKHKKDQGIYELINQPRYLLATILITNNFFNIGIIVVSFYLLNNLLDLTGLPLWVEVIINSVVVTAIIVLFGEVIPKVYATQRAKALAGFMSAPLLLAKKALFPFSKLLIQTSGLIEKRMKQHNDESITADEMDLAIDLTTQDNTNDEEVQMLKSIVRFGDIAVKDVMTSRPDIKAASTDLPFHQLVETVKQSGYSRIPVYSDDLDRIQGVLYAKDLLEHLTEENKYDWTALVRESLFVPENKKIDDLLEDFQQSHMHIAIVVDEYGGTVGLITLEDILEEIIGEIKDEFDDFADDVPYKKINEQKYIFEGKVSLFDMCKIVDADFHQFEEAKGESDSLAGLILELSGKLPQKDQIIDFGPYRFTVMEADNKRIKKVDVERRTEE